jgi:hypothetical protein
MLAGKTENGPANGVQERRERFWPPLAPQRAGATFDPFGEGPREEGMRVIGSLSRPMPNL